MLTNSEIMAISKKAKVRFFSNDVQTSLRNRSTLKEFIESIFKKENKRLDFINYIFCSDKNLLTINKKFLNHDFYTDVITFNLSENNQHISAEVYVSIDRVRDNAKKIGTSINSELHRVLFHAALHLCGYDDKKKIEIERMRRKEEELLAKYFVH